MSSGTDLALRSGMDPKRRLLLNLRRRITRVHTRQAAIAVDGTAVSYRCRCGQVERKTYQSEREAAFYFRWHKDGCSGNCQRCLKAKRNRLYPLTPGGRR